MKVLLKDMVGTLKNCEFKNAVIPMGIDEMGNFVYENYSKMNNIFVCGATGSGKSVFLDNILLSLTKQLNSDKLDLIIFDPKRVEFLDLRSKGYMVITDCCDAISICNDLVVEMERRYGIFVDHKVKNIEEYNEKEQNEKLKHIVVIFDEFGDFIYEDTTIYESLLKVIRMGRASGIHFIVSTQFPNLLKREIIKNNIITRVGIEFLESFTTKIVFLMCSEDDSKFIIKSNVAAKLKGNGEAIAFLPDKQYKVQSPYIHYKELFENIRDNNCEQMRFITSKAKVIKDEKGNPSNLLSKIAIINFTNNNDIASKLSTYFYQYEYSADTNMFSDSENLILKDDDILCIIYDNESDLKKENIKHFIDKARGCDIGILQFNTKNKTIDEIILLLDEISNLICEPALINIDIKDIKKHNIIDAFVVINENFNNADLKKEYDRTIDKYLSKIQNLNQVIVSVSGGYNTSLEEIFEYVDILRNKLPNDIDVIFGSNITEQCSDIHKVGVIFQGGGKEAHKKRIIEHKLQQSYKKFKQSDYMSLKSIEDEIHDKDFYKTQIEKFSILNEISTSTIQRYMRIGYPKAAQLIDNWERNGYIIRVGKRWIVENINSIIDDLKEIFKEKL